MTPKERLLAEYVRQIAGNTPGTIKESVGQGPGLELAGVPLEAAAGGLENALNDRAFRPGQSFALEAVVHKQFRPALLIQDGTFAVPPNPWAHVAAFVQELAPVIQAIGRVEVVNAGVPYGGTGAIVAPGLMLTNRHVAEIFTYGVGGASRLRMIPGRTARFENAHEHGRFPVNGLTYRVIKPVMVHPHWDAALLEVEFVGDPAHAPRPLTLCTTPPDAGQLANTEIVVIGYPYWSGDHEQSVLNDIFGGIKGVKRLQPGKLMRYETVESFGRPVEALLQDASTLPGNSGSHIIDLQTQQVVGLHFAGAYLTANYSVPVWELARDPRFVDAGVNFQPAAPTGQPSTPDQGGPIWLKAWAGRENTPAAASTATGTGSGAAAAAAPATPVAAPPVTPVESTLLDPGWFERYSDDELRRMYQRDPERFRSLLAATFSEEEAQDIYDKILRDASVEGVQEAPLDASLPEIILMPGILGSHLRGSFWGRSWLNLLTLPFSNLYNTLHLTANGNDSNSLAPDGYLQTSYAQAARTWRQQGFMVHEFSYDWRKPLAIAAQRLHEFMKGRRKNRPDARFALVCHSMGSLVASIFSRDVPEWRDFVEKAVFCGGPLGGSFAIMEMLSGEYPFVQKMASVSMNTSVQDMRQMGATFPGALEMLPHPALFSRSGADVEDLYRPESYASFARPGADWLRAARRIKDDLRSSPLLGRATCLVCVDRHTAGTFVKDARGEVRHSSSTVRGDGTVPAASALVPGVPAFRVTYEHSKLLQDPGVLAAVPEILRGLPVSLDEVTTAVLEQPLLEAPPPAPEALALEWAVEAVAVRERLRHGLGKASDIEWLLSSR